MRAGFAVPIREIAQFKVHSKVQLCAAKIRIVKGILVSRNAPLTINEELQS